MLEKNFLLPPQFLYEIKDGIPINHPLKLTTSKISAKRSIW